MRRRADFVDAEDGQFVHLNKDRSIAGLITQRRRLRCVLEVHDGIARHGISLPRSLQLGSQWRAVLAAGPQCLLCRADLAIGPDMDLLLCFGACILQLHSRLSEFLLQPDMVPPSPFLSCDPGITPGGSGWFYLTLLTY